MNPSHQQEEEEEEENKCCCCHCYMDVILPIYYKAAPAAGNRDPSRSNGIPVA